MELLILFLINFGISQGEGYIDSSKVRNPQLAWKLSIVPGLGQLYNGKFINSQKLKLPSGKILKGEERKLFEVERIKLDVKLAELKNYKK